MKCNCKFWYPPREREREQASEREELRGNYFLIVCPLLRLNEARNEELSENRASGKNILNAHLTANLDWKLKRP